MWFVLALGSAVFFALQSAVGKRLGDSIHPDVVAWAAFAFAAPVYLCYLLFEGIPEVNPAFAGWAAVSFGINLIAIPLYFKALKDGELSIVVPLVGLSPLFALGTEYLMMGEVPNQLAVVGVVLVVSGTYLLHVGSVRNGLFEPVRRLARDPGARCGIATALLWSVTAVADRGGVVNSNAAFYLSAFSIFYTLVLLPWLLVKRRKAFVKALRKSHHLSLVGLTGAVMALCQMSALGMTSAAPVIAVKRLAGLGGVILGGFMFRESEWQIRLVAAAVMVAGAVVLSFS